MSSACVNVFFFLFSNATEILLFHKNRIISTTFCFDQDFQRMVAVIVCIFRVARRHKGMSFEKVEKLCLSVLFQVFANSTDSIH